MNTAASSANVSLDLGSTAQALGSLTNPMAYLGTSFAGIVAGSGTGNMNSYIAASRSSSGTALPLAVYTSDAQQLSISSTGAVTLASTNLTVNGTTFTSVTNGKTAGIGFSAQTWTDVTSQRALGTTYTNSTARPISVQVYIAGNNQNLMCQFALYAGPVMVDMAYTHQYSDNVQLRGIIPVGVTYRAVNNNTPNTNSAAALSMWMELR